MRRARSQQRTGLLHNPGSRAYRILQGITLPCDYDSRPKKRGVGGLCDVIKLDIKPLIDRRVRYNLTADIKESSGEWGCYNPEGRVVYPVNYGTPSWGFRLSSSGPKNIAFGSHTHKSTPRQVRTAVVFPSVCLAPPNVGEKACSTA